MFCITKKSQLFQHSCSTGYITQTHLIIKFKYSQRISIDIHACSFTQSPDHDFITFPEACGPGNNWFNLQEFFLLDAIIDERFTGNGDPCGEAKGSCKRCPACQSFTKISFFKRRSEHLAEFTLMDQLCFSFYLNADI